MKLCVLTTYISLNFSAIGTEIPAGSILRYKMKIKDLKKMLSKLPDDLDVLISTNLKGDKIKLVTMVTEGSYIRSGSKIVLPNANNQTKSNAVILNDPFYVVHFSPSRP